jgi:hypothetical protein
MMAFPSTSFALALTDREGRRVLVHAGWWPEEHGVFRRIFRAVVDFDVPMDRTTARLASKALGIRRPKALIIHRGLLNRARTW